MLTRAIEVQKYCKASAGRANLHVVFENDKNQPRHDGSTIYLPAITIKTTLDDLEQLMVSVDHEVAHDKFSSFEVVQKAKLKPDSLIIRHLGMVFPGLHPSSPKCFKLPIFGHQNSPV